MSYAPSPHTPAHTPPRVLSIAGTDPSGGAGIQADLKSIAANGGYGMAVVTALVAQNTTGVLSVHVPPVSFLTEQLDAVSSDVTIDAVKIGMLANAEVIGAVDAWLARAEPPIVVVDPVMIATSGDSLLDPEAVAALRTLLERADVITPNIPELAVLAEEADAADWEAVLDQARRVSERYGVIVVAKGGHLGGPEAPDALVDAREAEPVLFSAARIETTHTHGTGCSLSAALATLAAGGEDWAGALRRAKAWLSESISAAGTLEVGRGSGPISHFAGLWSRGGLETGPGAEEILASWWEEVADVRAEIDALEFITGLADGTLPREAFTWYLAQDALYLGEYARVLAQASAIAPSAEEQGFWAQGARGAILGELELHEGWLSREALFDATPGPALIAYTDHLLAAGQRGDYGALIAAVLPCYWLYQDVGTRLHPHAGPGHPYSSWLDTYADPAFAEATEHAIAHVGAFAAAADAETRERMRRAFVLSCRHELAFWAAPLRTLRAAGVLEA